MSRSVTIRVIYPRIDGRVVLRTDADWGRDVEPTRRGDDGTSWEFVVTTDATFFYFKPCLRDGRGGLRWSVGSNYLAITTAGGAKDIYPHFEGGADGAITGPLEIAAPSEGGARRVRVYLPPGYAENTLKRYPTLYMHDGANLFFPEEAFFGSEWEIDETMDLLDAMNAIDKVIVVGVYSRDRMREYARPGWETYGRTLVEAIKPAVERSFRVLGGPSNTAVMGSSMGGLVSLYLAWQWPHVFGKAACLSSSFFYDNDLFERIAREPRRDLRVYLDSGWPEDNYEVTRSMRDLLVARGYEPGRDLLHFAFPRALHQERAWAMRSHIPFQFLFGKTPVFG